MKLPAPLNHAPQVTVHLYGGDIFNDKNIGGIIADARMVSALGPASFEYHIQA